MKILQTRIEKDFEFFVKNLPVLEPVEFMGLAKILGVPTVRESELLEIDKKMIDENADENEKQKIIAEVLIPADEILEKMMDKYLELTKRRRKEINQILKEIKKSKQTEVKENGPIA